VPATVDDLPTVPFVVPHVCDDTVDALVPAEPMVRSAESP
jgi:hypothetical protein